METFGITTACHHVASRPHGAARAAPRTRHKSGLRRWRYQQEWAHPELDDFDSDDNDSSCCCADEDLNDKSRDRGKRLRYSKTRLAVLVKPACKVFLHAMASPPASFDHWRYSMGMDESYEIASWLTSLLLNDPDLKNVMLMMAYNVPGTKVLTFSWWESNECVL